MSVVDVLYQQETAPPDFEELTFVEGRAWDDYREFATCRQCGRVTFQDEPRCYHPPEIRRKKWDILIMHAGGVTVVERDFNGDFIRYDFGGA